MFMFTFWRKEEQVGQRVRQMRPLSLTALPDGTPDHGGSVGTWAQDSSVQLCPACFACRIGGYLGQKMPEGSAFKGATVFLVFRNTLSQGDDGSMF